MTRVAFYNAEGPFNKAARVLCAPFKCLTLDVLQCLRQQPCLASPKGSFPIRGPLQLHRVISFMRQERGGKKKWEFLFYCYETMKLSTHLWKHTKPSERYGCSFFKLLCSEPREKWRKIKGAEWKSKCKYNATEPGLQVLAALCKRSFKYSVGKISNE